MSPARLKTLEAIAKIRDKENKILSTSFITLEWSLQRQKYETDVSNGGRFLRHHTKCVRVGPGLHDVEVV